MNIKVLIVMSMLCSFDATAIPMVADKTQVSTGNNANGPKGGQKQERKINSQMDRKIALLINYLQDLEHIMTEPDTFGSLLSVYNGAKSKAPEKNTNVCGSTAATLVNTKRMAQRRKSLIVKCGDKKTGKLVKQLFKPFPKRMQRLIDRQKKNKKTPAAKVFAAFHKRIQHILPLLEVTSMQERSQHEVPIKDYGKIQKKLGEIKLAIERISPKQSISIHRNESGKLQRKYEDICKKCEAMSTSVCRQERDKLCIDLIYNEALKLCQYSDSFQKMNIKSNKDKKKKARGKGKRKERRKGRGKGNERTRPRQMVEGKMQNIRNP